MGNAGSTTRERGIKGSDTAPPSPTKEGQAFIFDKKRRRKGGIPGSHDDDGPVYTKQTPTSQQEDFEVIKRQRAATVSEGTKVSDNKVLPTVFKWEGGGRQVYITGTFNDWKTNLPMVKSHGDFVTIIDLPEGEHEYKFFVDGQWKHDPNMRLKDSESGTKHNLITVKRSDFEVFQALANDSENHSGDLQSDYSQEIPGNVSWEKISGPPILPPHLLQVILNKDTPLSCEPTLLPEPNHVMLNHLYALSIKDGVMVLSATHRYQKHPKRQECQIHVTLGSCVRLQTPKRPQSDPKAFVQKWVQLYNVQKVSMISWNEARKINAGLSLSWRRSEIKTERLTLSESNPSELALPSQSEMAQHSEETFIERKAWAHEIINQNFSNVIFTEECVHMGIVSS